MKLKDIQEVIEAEKQDPLFKVPDHFRLWIINGKWIQDTAEVYVRTEEAIKLFPNLPERTEYTYVATLRTITNYINNNSLFKNLDVYIQVNDRKYFFFTGENTVVDNRQILEKYEPITKVATKCLLLRDNLEKYFEPLSVEFTVDMLYKMKGAVQTRRFRETIKNGNNWLFFGLAALGYLDINAATGEIHYKDNLLEDNFEAIKMFVSQMIANLFVDNIAAAKENDLLVTKTFGEE